MLAAVIALAVATPAQERFVMPVDEAGKDPSFKAFRSKLIAAVDRRDTAFIIRSLDRNVQLSYGGHAGVADFRKLWRPNDAKSKFWSAFGAVIRNGGHFISGIGKSRSSFYAPFTFRGFPDDLDAFEYAVIFGNNVNLRKTPAADGESIATLSYNVVKPTYSEADANDDAPRASRWIKVETLGGKSGYVRGDFVRSPIDYRDGFEKKGGVWRIVTFIAGD